MAAAERTARHLAMLQRLAELGMALAEAAAQQALAEPEPEDATVPAAAAGGAGMPALAADGDGAERSWSHADGARAERLRADPRLVFVRLSRAVRETIALEARLAAGGLGPAPRPRAEKVPPDPIMTVIHRLLHAAVEADTGADLQARRELHQDIDRRLADLSDIDPDYKLDLNHIVVAICDAYGLEADFSQVPDGELYATRRHPLAWVGPGANPPPNQNRYRVPPHPSGPGPP